MGNYLRKIREPCFRKSTAKGKKSHSSTSDSPPNSRESSSMDSMKNCEFLVLQPPSFESEHRQIVFKTWVILEQHIAEIGMNAYSKLFKRDPQIILHFPFLKHISKDEYENFLVLKNHTIRVMGIINILVQQLNFPPEKSDPELIETLQELGRNHYSYGASQGNIELLGKLFLESFMLPFAEYPDYTEIRQAWTKFFDFIIHWIKDGLAYVQRKGVEEGGF